MHNPAYMYCKLSATQLKIFNKTKKLCICVSFSCMNVCMCVCMGVCMCVWLCVSVCLYFNVFQYASDFYSYLTTKYKRKIKKMKVNQDIYFMFFSLHSVCDLLMHYILSLYLCPFMSFRMSFLFCIYI